MIKSVNQQQLDAEFALSDLHPDDAERKRSAEKRAAAYGLERSEKARETVTPAEPKARRQTTRKA